MKYCCAGNHFIKRFLMRKNFVKKLSVICITYNFIGAGLKMLFVLNTLIIIVKQMFQFSHAII